jgi:hypothetical protein
MSTASRCSCLTLPRYHVKQTTCWRMRRNVYHVCAQAQKCLPRVCACAETSTTCVRMRRNVYHVLAHAQKRLPNVRACAETCFSPVQFNLRFSCLTLPKYHVKQGCPGFVLSRVCLSRVCRCIRPVFAQAQKRLPHVGACAETSTTCWRMR